MKKLDEGTLRAHKGVSYVGVTTTAICHDGNGKFLMMKRGQNARDEQGTWDILGGGLKHGVPIKENLLRELEEELCTKAKDVVQLGLRDVHRVMNGIKTHWVAIDHMIHVDPEDVAIGEPDVIDEIGWFTLSDLPAPLHSQFMKLLDGNRKSIEKVLAGE